MRGFLSSLVLFSGLVLRVAAEEPAVPVPQFGETMTVVRYQIEARVTDAAGVAIRDLTAADFEVTIGKVRAEVEAADWVGTTRRSSVSTSSEPANELLQEEAPEGRLVVFFVQTDFGRNRDRILGQMAFTTNLAEKVLALLQPEDRIAVFSFDSHLKIRCDFTSNRAVALEAIRHAINIGAAPPTVEPNEGPSIASHLDAGEIEAVSRGEAALLLIARAISELEGEKLMVLAGWGFGEVSWGMGGGDRVVLPREWSDAVGILRRDHVPVITIGTGAGQLTLGIAMTARATGGVHTSAVGHFPVQTLNRIGGALVGYYELLLRTDPPLVAGEHVITIRAKDSRYRVYATPVIVVDRVDTRFADAIAVINEGQAELGVQMLRDSMAAAELPADVLVERMRMFVDAAQWDAALVVIERIEATGVVDGEVAAMRDEARRTILLRKMSGAHSRLTEARRLLLDGETTRSLALLNEAVEIAPKLADAWHERGMLLLSLGRTDEARASLRRCLELEPRGANAVAVREILAGIDPAQ